MIKEYNCAGFIPTCKFFLVSARECVGQYLPAPESTLPALPNIPKALRDQKFRFLFCRSGSPACTLQCTIWVLFVRLDKLTMTHRLVAAHFRGQALRAGRQWARFPAATEHSTKYRLSSRLSFSETIQRVRKITFSADHAKKAQIKKRENQSKNQSNFVKVVQS